MWIFCECIDLCEKLAIVSVSPFASFECFSLGHRFAKMPSQSGIKVIFNAEKSHTHFFWLCNVYATTTQNESKSIVCALYLCGDDERVPFQYSLVFRPYFHIISQWEMYSFLRTCIVRISSSARPKFGWNMKIKLCTMIQPAFVHPFQNINTYHAIGNSYTRTQWTQQRSTAKNISGGFAFAKMRERKKEWKSKKVFLFAQRFVLNYTCVIWVSIHSSRQRIKLIRI